jgi:hypothetical protein
MKRTNTNLLAIVFAKNVLPFYRIEIDSSDAETLARYQREFTQRSGMAIDMGYLTKAKVVLFYIGTKPVAGYILNVAEWTTLRYLSFFSERLTEQVLDNADLQKDNLLELTGIWKQKNLALWYSALFYLSMLTDASRTGKKLGKKYLLGGSVLRQIRRLQQQLLTIRVFIGVLPDSGLTKHNDDLVAIYACKLADMPRRAGLLMIKHFVLRGRWQEKLQFKIHPLNNTGRLAGA